MKRAPKLVFSVALFVVLVWLCGRLLSDRWVWTQWIAWIPSIAVATTLGMTTAALALLHQKKKALITSTILITVTAWIMLVENHVLSVARSEGDLRIVAWTMSHPKKEVAELSAQIVVELDADITLLTHGWYVRSQPVIKEWLGKQGKRLISGPFTLLTTLRPIEVRTLVASDGIFISMYRLDTKEQLGQELVLYAVDFPSGFTESRIRTARRAKRLLRQVGAPPPDIVLGDFNMTRNSKSIRRLFPTLTDAWDHAGIGWSSSYHRAFPLYHIDHTLICDDLHAVLYELVNPELGRHCVQLVEIAR